MTSLRWISELARALINRSVAEDVVVDVLRSAHTLDRSFDTRPSMITDLSNPATPLADRDAALTHALKGSCHPYLVNACRLLLQHHGFDALRVFLLRVREEARRRANVEDAEIRFADLPDASVFKHLEESVSSARGRTVVLHAEEDASVEAGFCVNGLDWSLDASLHGARERLYSHLLA